MDKSKRIEMDNLIRVSSSTIRDKGLSPYFECILLRCQPKIYNKYGCVKVRFTKDKWAGVYFILCQFWHLGLACDKIERMPDGIKIGRGTVIDEMYEATLKKIGAIMFDDNEEYSSRMSKLWEDRDIT